METPPIHPVIRGIGCLFGVMLLVAAASYVRSVPPRLQKSNMAWTVAVLAGDESEE